MRAMAASAWCAARPKATRFPFILLPMRIRRGLIAPPAMQLIYCRDIAEYVAMRRRHRPAAAPAWQDFRDSGFQRAGARSYRHLPEARGRKYFKGPHRPRLADLTDTELVLYGPDISAAQAWAKSQYSLRARL